MAVVNRWKNRDGKPSAQNQRGKQWVVRYRDPQGVQRTKSFKLKAEADAYYAQVSVDIKSSTWVDPKDGKQTFNEFGALWLQMNEPHWRPATRRQMRQVVEIRVGEHIGSTPMARITAMQVQAMVNAWVVHYAPATVVFNVRALRTIMLAAVDAGVIAKDPSKKVKAPKAPRRRNTNLSHEDVALILTTSREEFRPFLAMLAWCGPRIGEGLAINLDDVDWLAGSLSISKQQGTDYANATIDSLPKTEAGVRVVPMPKQLVEMCSTMLAERRLAAGEFGDNLWESPVGGRMQRTNVDSEIRRIRSITGKHFSAHHLRHYYGASLISAGVPIPQVSKQMGHANPQVTLNVYAYAMKDDVNVGRAAVDALASQFQPCAPDVRPIRLGGPIPS